MKESNFVKKTISDGIEEYYNSPEEVAKENARIEKEQKNF